MEKDKDRPLEPYHHTDPQYARAFQIFLSHTNQKRQALGWLTDFVRTLPARRTFVDAGAGDGSVTAVLAELFDKTLAIEPSAELRAQLAQNCPAAELRDTAIADTQIGTAADFVLCSHVLYHIGQESWLATIERLTSWLCPGGAAAVILGNPQADGLRLLQEFFGISYDLRLLAQEFETRHGGEYDVAFLTLPAEFIVPDLEPACIVTQFFLSDYHRWPRSLTRRNIEDYVQSHFAQPAGYRMVCDQDILQVHRR